MECRGQDAGEAQARAGMAWFYTAYGKSLTVKAAETEAKEERRGLWADTEPIAPREWRHAQGEKIRPAAAGLSGEHREGLRYFFQPNTSPSTPFSFDF
ncbi:thermonuclease family protein [Ramlibacter sp.]|uniref:thermonuclease family protein n=1 Tax=Ramlibacter sp. TaxID=1917967 RepID=UPI0025D9A764|nr:thermonuclease family protein [Ramlibacter sp.]